MMWEEKQIQIRIQINDRLYIKDPQRTELGQKILAHSAKMIDEMGFEHFTFRKLAMEIASTEASIYRYFENKHKLLIYLVSWYWNWLSYRLTIEANLQEAAAQRLKRAVLLFCHALEPATYTTAPIDPLLLQKIIIQESPKAYLTKEVDADNKEGAFMSYKGFCRQVAEILKVLAPDYTYPAALISTAVEAAHHQKYFSEHLPSLTEVSGGDKAQLADFLTDMIFRVIGKQP